MSDWPEAFLSRLKGQLGDELPAFLRACEQPPLRGIRFFPDPEAETLFRGELEKPVPWAEHAWYLKTDSGAGQTIFHEAGAFYLQEPSAMLPAAVMAARAGEYILDLCAAPGGKSTQMGCDMRGQGLLVSNEPVPKRAQVLSRNVERMGLPHTLVTCAWPEALADRWPGAFDGVMVDAPCSGEGMFRRHPETRAEWSREKAAGCAERQADILEQAARLVRPGGRLVYATCTFHPAENEDQIARFLARHPDFSPESFRLPGVDGSSGMWTCWPHRCGGEGQFVARLRREGGEDGPAGKAIPRANGGRVLSREEANCWRSMGLQLPEPTGRLGNMLCALPAAPDVRGLKVLRMGLQLGEFRGRHFIPDHALALCRFAPAADPPARLTEVDAETALRYLAGEAIPGSLRGWTVLRYRGQRLGWGKGADGRIQNHYPRGLRNNRLFAGPGTDARERTDGKERTERNGYDT